MWMQFISSTFAAICLLLASYMLGLVGPILLLAAASFAAWYSHDESNSAEAKQLSTIVALVLGVIAFFWLVVVAITYNL